MVIGHYMFIVVIENTEFHVRIILYRGRARDSSTDIYIYIRFYGRNRETYHFDVGDQRVFRWWNYRRVVFARKLSEKTIRYMFSIPWHAMHRVRWIRMQFSYFRFVSRKKWGFCFSEGSKGSFPDHHRSRALCSEPPNPIYCIKGFGVPC